MIVELIDANMHDNGLIFATIDVTDDDGNTTRLGYFFPPDTMEWRAAEYDLDPVQDVDLLVDIVLFEPHIQIPDDKMLYKTDRMTARAALVDIVTTEKGKSDAAKAARRPNPDENAADIAKRETDARMKIRALSVWHPDVVKMKREFVVKKHEEIRNMPPQTDRLTAEIRKKQFREMSSSKDARKAIEGEVKNG